MKGHNKVSRFIEREAAKPALPSPPLTLQTTDGRRALLPVTTLREIFSLPTFAYDTEGYPVVSHNQMRFHSYIGEILILPFLQGLYQARAETIDCYLETDEMFDTHIDAILDASAAGGISRVGVRKKTAMIQRLHQLVVKAIGIYARQTNPGKTIHAAFSSLVTSGVRLGISSDKFLKTVERDIVMLRKNPNLQPDVGRELRDLALETPPNVVGPPSPYAELFLTNLRTIRWAVKATMFAVTFDQVVVFLAAGLSVFLIEGLPMSDEDKETFGKSENLKKLVSYCLSAISESVDEDVKEGLLQLLEGVESYIYGDGDMKKPLELCLELLDIAKPVVEEAMRRLLQLDGFIIYSSLIGDGNIDTTADLASFLRPPSSALPSPSSSSSSSSSSAAKTFSSFLNTSSSDSLASSPQPTLSSAASSPAAVGEKQEDNKQKTNNNSNNQQSTNHFKNLFSSISAQFE
uniref:Uncharacterized protein n=1 Tax=Paramoeba aestuarina TaxID=180227 RepID=A0A7S4PFA1_9EUKA